jgi:PIN domain
VPLRVLLDACVLFPPSLRDFLLELGFQAVIEPRWSDEIQDEWINAAQQRSSENPPDALHRVRKLMDVAIPDALTGGYQHLLAGLSLPDRNDRHVLA